MTRFISRFNFDKNQEPYPIENQLISQGHDKKDGLSKDYFCNFYRDVA